MITKLNLVEYANMMSVSVAAINYRIRNEIVLPGVIKTEQFKNWYILHYNTETDIKEAKMAFKRLITD